MSETDSKLAITGDIGSGKSAVSRVLCERTGFQFYSTGSLQRQIAERRGMTTLELNRYSETHREIDDEIDDASRALGQRQESFVIDSRLAWHFIPHAFKIYLVVDPEEAARRILGDDDRRSEGYDALEDALENIRARRQSELRRFKDLYGVDLADGANYDLVVDTSSATPEQIADVILSCVENWRGGRPFAKSWRPPEVSVEPLL